MSWNCSCSDVRERHPLKQGLKHSAETLRLETFWSSGKTSTKTRIETDFFSISTKPSKCSGKTSTKTRIETYEVRISDFPHAWVRERHPLKQGLKQWLALIVFHTKNVRERHPLKQGLKRNWRVFLGVFNGVRERHPLKQGLKQWNRSLFISFQQSSGKTSTKTRIET